MIRIGKKSLFIFAVGVFMGFRFSRSVYYDRIFRLEKVSSDEAIDVNESTQIRGLMSTTEASTTKSSEEGPGPNIDIDLIKPLAGDGTEPCPYNSSDLLGLHKPQMNFRPSWREINALMEKLNIKNGCSVPQDCVAEQKVAIIIPYKDREEHLVKWLWNMHQILVRQRREYCVFVAEPLGSGHFNKGATMNSAVSEAISRGFDCVVLHDVDMLLEDDHNIYACEDSPVHLSPLIDKFKYKDHYGTEFGGVTMLKTEQYIKANGYSNLYWGWGKEDDDMAYRVISSGQNVIKPKNYDSGRYSMIPHQHPWAFRNSRLTDKESDLRFLSLENIGNSKYRYKFEGFNSIQSKVNQEERNPGFIKLKVDFRSIEVLKVIIKNDGDVKMLEMDPNNYRNDGYIELSDTYICKEYGFKAVMKWLKTWHASETSAIQKCNEFPDYCIGITRKGGPITGLVATDYMLREVSQLISGVTARKPDGCAPGADNPVTLHKQVVGEQRRLHVIKDTITMKTKETFSITIDFSSINGLEKGIYYRHALVWEGRAIKGVQAIQLVQPTEEKFGPEKQTKDLKVIIETPLPGWYTVLSKITDCIGTPMFELRWAFRISTNNAKFDEKMILTPNNLNMFKGDEWGFGMPLGVFKFNLDKYYNTTKNSR